MHQELQELLAGNHKVLELHGRTALARAVQRAERQGLATRLLPGIYCAATCSADLAVRVAAAATLDPDAIVCSRAAAALLWWPGLTADPIECVRNKHHKPQPGYRWRQRTISDELIVEHEGVRLTSAALTVLDLIPEMGGDVIDEALRRRAVTLAALQRALELTPDRPGNTRRSWLIEDSRDQPWSPAERRLHRIYRSLDLPFRYATNHRVLLENRVAFLDLALPDLRLGFEVDGWTHHGTRQSFEYDRDRNSELASLSWQLVSLSAAMVEHQERVVAHRLRRTIDCRAALFGLPDG